MQLLPWLGGVPRPQGIRRRELERRPGCQAEGSLQGTVGEVPSIGCSQGDFR